MRPAASLILFTVLSGLGLGLVFWTGLGTGPETRAFAGLAGSMALLLAGAGGAASVLHLARPDRGWRAFREWRTSWLSREAWLMVATLGVFAVFAGLWAVAGLRLWGLGALAAAGALATVHATAMIYAQLRTVPRWHRAPTPQLFLALALAGGLLAHEALAALASGGAAPGAAALALALSAGVAMWWQTSASGARRGTGGETLESATALTGRGRVRAFEAPHTARNYLLDEMAHVVGRRRAWQLRWIGAGAGFLLPLALCLAAWAAWDWLLVPALASHAVGVMALRWLFFAEAEHVQALYYGARAL